ncbi:glycosyltransferase [Guyparkeria halophila]|uniref:Glycosyltransferase n=1 Tax=Guyparkeria halophila TaxID=47960 RepID=A0A6I6D2D1_9GAMM|nr:glycosyltransferase family 4 protein [Guyparkeria halophila]QGT78307.1 glycosyltransferase [Guyparkeria halophila]
MKRILFLVSSMQGGGAERVAALLSNYWVQQGHQLTLMPTFSGRGECLYPLDKRVRLDYLADRVRSRSRSPLNKLRRLTALRGAVRELSPDVIVSFLPHVNVAAVIATLGLGVPVVISERTYPPAMSLGVALNWLRRWAYPRASAVVVQTGRAREWLTRCCPKARGHVIANPIVYPLPRDKPEVNPSAVVGLERRVVLAVGRLSEEKQFDRLVRAFEALVRRYPEWDLVVLGEGPERQRLERERDRLGLTGRVYLPGRVGNLSDWYQRADLYVMSSRFEGFPNTLAEAMAYGLPAVSFDCDTGPRDIIRDGVDGYLVPRETGASGLAGAMEALMRDESQRKQMAEEAVVVRDRFSMERIAAKWDVVLGLTEDNDI